MEEVKNISLNITNFVKRMIEINKKASDYGYEDKYDSVGDAINEIEDIIDRKLCQWEYELRYDLSKKDKTSKSKDIQA